MDVMHICIIIALDIVITSRFSINCSIVICSPIILFSFKRQASSETYGPRVYSPLYIFRYINQKTQKYLASIYLLLFFLRFSNLLYLSLSDITLEDDREGIENPSYVLGCKFLLFVCAGVVHIVFLGSPTRLISLVS